MEPLKIEDIQDGDYFRESKEDPNLFYKYRYKLDRDIDPVYIWSPWIKLKLHEFVGEMQRNGIKISVFDTHTKRMSAVPSGD